MEFTEDFENKLKQFIHIDDTVLLAKGKQYYFNEYERQFSFGESCLTFDKLIYKKRRYSTYSYAKTLKINDSIIEINSREYGIIHSICVVENNPQKIIIFYYIITTEQRKIFHNISHIKECKIHFDIMHHCTPKYLQEQCILMNIINKNYICNVPVGCVSD